MPNAFLVGVAGRARREARELGRHGGPSAAHGPGGVPVPAAGRGRELIAGTRSAISTPCSRITSRSSSAVRTTFFPEVNGREKFWQDGARTAFLGIAVLIAETPDEALNPQAVFRWFARGDAAAELARRIETRRKTGNPYSQTCVDLISDYLTGTEEVVKGVRKHVTATMGLWFNPKIAAATSRSDFDLKQLRRRRMSVYVAVMPADLGQLGVLLRLFFTQLFEANTDVLPEQDDTIHHKCHVLLDEFTSIPAMRPLAKAAGSQRGSACAFPSSCSRKTRCARNTRGRARPACWRMSVRRSSSAPMIRNCAKKPASGRATTRWRRSAARHRAGWRGSGRIDRVRRRAFKSAPCSCRRKLLACPLTKTWIPFVRPGVPAQ